MGASQSKGPTITPHDRAVLDLKLQRDRIRQYQKKINLTLESETTIARRALASNNKPLALAALRKKKYQQSLLLRTDEQLSTLQSLVSSIEFSQIQASVIEGLKQGNTVLKQLNDSMRIEDVERIMEQGEEARAYQQEVAEVMASQMSGEEEEEVQRELLVLEREARGEEVGEQEQVQEQDGGRIDLPNAPTQEPVKQHRPELERQQEQPPQPTKQRVQEALLA